ncbi:nucleoside phosphorylase [Marinigracilibium pacificum]|uniref:Uridine phosphorylase n=1 Tax=Marinigracilibium pacificum TaxID=2729599 RepID=A0A848J422_9BACT|nr:nucleoside phosphorylase [Marinigracilibium pacificum]NMM49099.1 nucleoside phosphorylase [Marinigracilibium pacificum]
MPIHESELILNKDKSVYHLSLRPENIADTVLTVGDPSRVHMVSKYFDDIEFEMNKREFITHTGRIGDKRLTVMSTGMGTENIEIVITELDALVNIDFKTREVKKETRSLNIIRIGTSGALQEDIPIGSCLVSEYGVGLDNLMIFYDLSQTPFEQEICAKLKEDIPLPITPYCVKADEGLLRSFDKEGFIKGNTVTSPGFYAPQGRALRVNLAYGGFMDKLVYFHKDNFWLTNFEMETSGYYAMSRMLGHKAISTNAILANRIQNKFANDSIKIVDQLIKQVIEVVTDENFN